MMSNVPNVKTVASLSPEVSRIHENLPLVAALLGGTKAMRLAGESLLPRFAREEKDDYAARLARSYLFPAYQRTVTTLSAKPFSRPLTLGDDVPARMKPWLENVDLQGRNLHAFASECFAHAMGRGFDGILVEYPRVPENTDPTKPLSQAEEERRNIRPYLVRIGAERLIGWRAKFLNGVWTLTQVRFFEDFSEDDGEYGAKTARQIKVINEKTFEVHREGADGKWAIVEQGANTLGVVPFVPVYGKREAFMVGTPPLLELAQMNVAHWQSSSDQTNILHIARVPILAAVGVDKAYELVVGASTATKLPMGADLKWVEVTGASIQAGADDIKAIEERMRQIGAELLVLAPGNVTASQVLTENAIGACALSQMAEIFEDSLDLVLSFMAKWARIESGGGHVKLFNQYAAASLAEASASLLKESASAGLISSETYYAELQRRGIVAPDVTWEQERDRIASEGPSLPTDPLDDGDETKGKPQKKAGQEQ